ncbi:IclR family transcriptional regulator C-terminal domain-containing protein [Streptomyces sp. NPDC096311]|uniref:IclR family transcriptional regulator domain-containing protein n=1 Tax=Streptomyces sp. NPDC096311 TaxID=3366083 RepID=UPI00381C6117
MATEGATAIAAPVRDANGTIVAALSVVGPSFRTPPRVITRHGEQVRMRSTELSDLIAGKNS